jgi:tetratricopeptide (TPR) repeat protein
LTEDSKVGATVDSEAVSGLFEKANEAYDAGEYDKAVEILNESISRDPRSVVALNNKGAALDALGRRNEAEECYRAALALLPSYELAWHNLGNCLFAQERFREAHRAYSRADSLNPSRVENLLGLAESKIELGNRRGAEATIRRVTPAAERSHSLLLAQADLYVLLRDGTKAVERCDRYIALHPLEVDGYIHLGGVRHEMGQYVDAIPAFERALEISPDDTQIWNNLGYTCWCAGQVDRALEAFDRAIAIDPEYKHAWYNKGYALHGVDRLEEAVACYRRAIDIDSRDRVLLNNLGNALYNLGRYAESIPLFVEAINVDPDYEIAWNNIGNALERMGLFKEAVPFHDRSLEIRPDFDYALYAKGVCKGATGEPEEGYDLILESLDINPLYDEAWKARARVAIMLGRLDDALASVDRAVTLNPRFCEGWQDRGDVLLDLGDGAGAEQSYCQALKCLDQLAQEYENDGEPWAMRARTLVRLARHGEALESAVRGAAARHPDTSALPLAFELCRIMDIDAPPNELVALAKDVTDLRLATAWAGYLAHRTDWHGVVQVYAAFERDSLPLQARLLLVRAHTSLGDAESAESLLRSTPEGDREEVRAEIRLASRDVVAAVESLGRVLSNRPGDYRLTLSLARAYLLSGRPREALRAAEMASGIDPRDWEALEVEAEACDALGLGKRADRARKRASQLLARCASQRATVDRRGGA